MVVLGPYELGAPLGRGGMGVVWGAVHRDGTPVAVKVLSSAGAGRPDFQRAFQSEVRAVAMLDHPRVVAVLDHGVVPGAASKASGGSLVEGSPYLVLERVVGGSLIALTGRCSWERTRQVLLDLLDALAHAHARGVVHRDLKPANVLLDERGRVKLTDFGLAHLSIQGGEAAGGEGLSGGTPAYTAPEQFMGAWRDLGPWTDLYALGCLTWKLLCGHGPFRVRGWMDGMRQHLASPVPALRTPTPVPGGLEGWLRRLLAKDPAERYRRAADAAWALSLLESAAEGARPPSPPVDHDSDTVLSGSDPRRTTLVWLRQGGGTAREVAAPEVDLPPLPLQWVRPRRVHRWLSGAGLGLYGLRSLPVVGRQIERDRLWAALQTVHAGEGPRAVVLRGPAGAGKSRLAEWLAHRAHEVGAAEVLRVGHGPHGGPRDGLRGLMLRETRTEGLSSGEARERLRGAYAASADPWIPMLTDDAAALSAAERRGAALGFIHHLTRSRPGLLWIDDAQWGLDTVLAVRQLLSQGRGRVLVVLTVREEALVDHPETQVELEALDAERLEVSPLPASDHRVLVRQLLGLHGALAARVEARTAGNPLFAVQLVGDWVQRGVLVETSEGFDLAPDADAAIPTDLGEVWRDRVDRVLDTTARRAVELAAALGVDVAVDEWEAACAHAGLPVPWDGVHALLDARLALAERDPTAGWRFVHGMLREALLERARADGRWRDVHVACAAALEAGAPQQGRRGRHLFEAGEYEAALAPLLLGVDHAANQDYRLAVEPLELREEALRRLGVPADDPRWAVGYLQRARILRLRGRWSEARDALEALAEQCATHQWLNMGIQARGDLAIVLRAQGRASEAGVLLRGALSDARALDDLVLVERIGMRLVLVHCDAGRMEQAREQAREVLALAAQSGDRLSAGHTRIALSGGCAVVGEVAEAEQLALAALADYRAAGTTAGVANALNTLGETARMQGRLEDAARRYASSLETYERISSGHAVLPRANLGLVLLTAGRWREALAVLEEALAELQRQGRRPLCGVIALCVARACLGLDQRAEALEHLREGARLLRDTGTRDADALGWARRTAEAAQEIGASDLARAAWEVVRMQAELLGQSEPQQAAERGLAQGT